MTRAMQRALVIGSGGAGKSTFAKRLGEATGLPVVHLDACYWRPGWDPMPKDEWTRTIDAIMARDAWIMDGNYGGTLDQRLGACDTVIFLDVPRTVCLRRVLWRSLRYRGRSRPDMAPGCPERITLEFVRWIWEYPRKRRPGILQRLETLAAEKRVVILESTHAVERFLRDAGDFRV
jgi:adenylate kinase family enzyme